MIWSRASVGADQGLEVETLCRPGISRQWQPAGAEPVGRHGQSPFRTGFHTEPAVGASRQIDREFADCALAGSVPAGIQASNDGDAVRGAGGHAEMASHTAGTAGRIWNQVRRARDGRAGRGA